MPPDARQRAHLSRVPPHDDATEECLLGAALMHRPAAEVVAGIAPEDFYRPQYLHVAEVIGHLVKADKPTDAGSVAAELRQRGQLDALHGRDKDGEITGPQVLLHLMAICPSFGAAAHWGELIQGFARKRRQLGLAAEIVEAVYSNVPTTGLVVELSKAAEDDAEATSTSWAPVNLTSVLAGEGATAEATMLARTDGKCLLYAGKVHAFNAESEAMKSWLALWACVERIRAGENVLYIDFEAGAVDIVGRLLELGLSPLEVQAHFYYVQPDEALDAGARLRMVGVARDIGATLCVIDGLAEVLALSGWDENKPSDVTTFYSMLPRPLARTGAAVINIDHLALDEAKKMGNDARGTGAKRAGIDGAQFRLDCVKPFARDGEGLSRIIVTKDRHGHVRGISSGGKLVGELHMTSREGGSIVTAAIRPSTTVGPDGTFRPTGLMPIVSRWVQRQGKAVTSSWLVDNLPTKARPSTVVAALDALVADGFVQATQDGRTTWYSHLRSYSDRPDEPEGDEWGDEF